MTDKWINRVQQELKYLNDDNLPYFLDIREYNYISVDGVCEISFVVSLDDDVAKQDGKVKLQRANSSRLITIDVDLSMKVRPGTSIREPSISYPYIEPEFIIASGAGYFPNSFGVTRGDKLKYENFNWNANMYICDVIAGIATQVRRSIRSKNLSLVIETKGDKQSSSSSSIENEKPSKESILINKLKRLKELRGYLRKAREKASVVKQEPDTEEDQENLELKKLRGIMKKNMTEDTDSQSSSSDSIDELSVELLESLRENEVEERDLRNYSSDTVTNSIKEKLSLDVITEEDEEESVTSTYSQSAATLVVPVAKYPINTITSEPILDNSDKTRTFIDDAFGDNKDENYHPEDHESSFKNVEHHQLEASREDVVDLIQSENSGTTSLEESVENQSNVEYEEICEEEKHSRVEDEDICDGVKQSIVEDEDNCEEKETSVEEMCDERYDISPIESVDEEIMQINNTLKQHVDDTTQSPVAVVEARHCEDEEDICNLPTDTKLQNLIAAASIASSLTVEGGGSLASEDADYINLSELGTNSPRNSSSDEGDIANDCNSGVGREDEIGERSIVSKTSSESTYDSKSFEVNQYPPDHSSSYEKDETNDYLGSVRIQDVMQEISPTSTQKVEKSLEHNEDFNKPKMYAKIDDISAGKVINISQHPFDKAYGLFQCKLLKRPAYMKDQMQKEKLLQVSTFLGIL